MRWIKKREQITMLWDQSWAKRAEVEDEFIDERFV